MPFIFSSEKGITDDTERKRVSDELQPTIGMKVENTLWVGAAWVWERLCRCVCVCLCLCVSTREPKWSGCYRCVVRSTVTVQHRISFVAMATNRLKYFPLSPSTVTTQICKPFIVFFCLGRIVSLNVKRGWKEEQHQQLTCLVFEKIGFV